MALQLGEACRQAWGREQKDMAYLHAISSAVGKMVANMLGVTVSELYRDAACGVTLYSDIRIVLERPRGLEEVADGRAAGG